MSSKNKINEDLDAERRKCNFNIEEVTYIIDGGKDKTLQRKKIEDIALNGGAHLDDVPEECLNVRERYENALRKSCLFANLVKNELLEITGFEKMGSPVLRRTTDAYFKDISPLMLHLGMFVPSIIGHCTAEQQAVWLPRALALQVIGAYAQTELGHGTFIRGLETTATYDPQTEEFVLHSPKITSYKWWAGGLGRTANHCTVVAQLYTQGKCYGTHLFIVQIRDLETHMPLPGIKVGEIGPRMGFNTADNGFLAFDHYRIPRMNMMMKNEQVLQDGTYVKVARHGKLTYGTMVFVRVTLVGEASFNLAKAVTIAVRYSAVRRQSELRPGSPEPQILDYPTQQHKLFICIATAHAFQLTATWLWDTFTLVQADIKKGNVDTLPELHALSSCLKAVSTADATTYIEQCRFACGGHGYMMSSNLPYLYSFVAATRTYEGDYTVMLLQTARFLVKAWEQAETGSIVTPTIAYLNRHFSTKEKVAWNNSPEGIIKSFQAIAAGKICLCVQSIRNRVKSGMDYEDAWLMTTVQLVSAAEAHCRSVLLDVYWNEMQRLTQNSSDNVKIVMNQLVSLYLVYWALERTGDLLRYSSICEKDIDLLQMQYEELLAKIRPNAVGLVDAFDLRDEILHSTLGAYDGRVYERLLEEAQKNPLNKEPVDPSFHKYLKPFIKSKTELGHGTFIRGLETTATYDPQTEEFVLHSPKITSYKWWAGGLGRTANHCTVVAQLYTQGKCYGTHLFIVQIRDLETHMPLPGIKVGEIGPRMGFNTADNGFLAFDHYRIPRMNMMMKNEQVLQDGTYVKVARHGKLTYGTMVFVRVTLVGEASFNLAKAVTIAVRYSAVRRQSELRPGSPEPQILDYPTQQHKLFICIATAHAFQLTATWLWDTFTLVQAEIKKGNVDTLPELHALSSCLKAVSTADATTYIEQCRFACGGHGYMMSSNLPYLYSFVAATRTYEGDYTVMLLQTARFLVKAWEQAETGSIVTPTIAYLNRHFSTKEKVAWNNSPEGIIKSFQAIAAGKICLCVQSIRNRVKSGMDYEDAWLMTTVQLVSAAEAHCRSVLLDVYWNEMQRLTQNSSDNVKVVMNQLVSLYLVYWALERTGDLLRYSSICEKDIDLLQMQYEELLAKIRPNAVGLVDAFDLRDEILHSTLGAYDGRVYERLLEEAQKNPLNKEPVDPSFHKYLKPFIKSKM